MLGGPVLRQHVVEFVPGVGVITDGIVDATSTAGPWDWTSPVDELEFEGVGAGGGGAGGQNTGTQRAGGSGGGSGLAAKGKLLTRRGDVLTITPGAGGPGTAAGSGFSSATAGGDLTVSGLTRISAVVGVLGATANTLVLSGGAPGTRSATAGTSGAAGGGGAKSFGGGAVLRDAGPGAGSAAAATPTVGGSGLESATYSVLGIFLYAQGGSAGGPASTSPTTAGANGGAWHVGAANRVLGSGQTTTPSGIGTQDGTNSYGGGGDGGASPYGRPGLGGDGNADNATDASGYGAGGAGGGGNGAGKAGSPSYLRFTYWSAD